ncbi:MAG: tripartite tricarboxylate transporter substrate-binding protein [Pigmentiphaga sp.]|uniref:tripartite tricarboxylate transporter substrate-binding protein n=1 Tax=Pigmentiphaga sp. TaxID=1977564 RepID=UPI0029A38C3C|nr:tripartite tricarboxylate transporter substrate-binding protein [Pigmentiphaga sp.]MDX3904229.1 tripartite tricarboxylate transporter substrate-binding protein [Pigmentiphaga sp.]
MNRLLRRMSLAAWLASCIAASAVAADATYPSRPIRMVVPYAVGGSTDLLGRQVAQRLGAVLGQQVFVENLGGAGSTIGTAAVARAAADGYTIGLLDTAFAINPGLYSNLPYDSLKDFDFLSVVATANGVLVVNAKRVKARTVAELVEEARAKPDQLSFASAGAGTVVHLHGETFKTAAGIKLLHVPYKGAGPAIADLLGGQVDMMFNLPALVVQQVRSGVLFPVAVTGARRSPLFPETPSFAEAGYPGVDAVSLWVIAAPKGLPAEIHDKLVAAIGQAMEGSDMEAKLTESSFERTVVPYPKSVDFLRQQMAKFAAAVKASGATVN